MEATKKKTTMAVMMTNKQREMANVRQEIAKIFTMYEGFVKEDLGGPTREAQVILGRDTIEGSESDAEAIKRKEKQLDEKIKEMKEKKEYVEGCLKHLRPSDLQSQASASEGKIKVALEYELKIKNAEMDKKLETILEDASIKSKEEEFKLLDEQLQMCLLCFSIFPMDAEIMKRVLIYWWIGEGFVTAKGEKTAEEVGEDCFKKLVKKEFIQPVYNRRRRNILRCKMHPWIRWMIIRLSRKEEFFNLDESGMPSSSPSKSRRACIMTENKDGQLDEEYWPESNKADESKETTKGSKETKQPLQKTPKKSKEKEPKGKESTLLTLFNVNVRYLKFKYGVEFLPKLKTLVVLQLGSWRGSSHDHMNAEDPKKQDDPGHHIEIEEPQMLDGLSALVHLRYLSLRSISRITELPSSIKALRNLEILDLRGCQNLEKLTEEIKWLHRLTHLDVSDCYMLAWMPKGISFLSELQVLKGFVFGGYRSRDPCKLADLQILKKLRKLSISIGKQVNESNVDLNELHKIEGLISVAITWSAAAFTGLSFPTSIVKLDLRCFPESELPSSFDSEHLVHLEKLYIRGGKLAKLDFGETRKIKMLRLKFLKEMKLENVNIQALFPQLEYLEVYECDNIKLTDELDSDGVWVKEAIDGSTPASAAATTSPEASLASTAATTSPEASLASTAPTTTSEAPPASAASTITPEAPPASAASTTTIQEAPLASAAPTTNPEAPLASIAPATTPEASSASAAPTTTPEAAPATTAPTTTPEAAAASATPTTTSEAPPASAVPTPIPEASPTSAAPTTITKDPPASATSTTTQEASPASTTPTRTAEASSTSNAPTATPDAPTTTASAAPATTPEASATSAALATTPEASPASAAPATTPEATPASAAPITTQASPASAAPTTT